MTGASGSGGARGALRPQVLAREDAGTGESSYRDRFERLAGVTRALRSSGTAWRRAVVVCFTVCVALAPQSGLTRMPTQFG